LSGVVLVLFVLDLRSIFKWLGKQIQIIKKERTYLCSRRPGSRPSRPALLHLAVWAEPNRARFPFPPAPRGPAQETVGAPPPFLASLMSGPHCQPFLLPSFVTEPESNATANKSTEETRISYP
jgi:hypothetical protein